MQDTTKMSFFWVIAAIWVLAATKANAEMIKGYPDAIICHPGNSRAIAYLDDVKDDSSALYKPLLAETYATVTPDHILHYHGTAEPSSFTSSRKAITRELPGWQIIASG